MSDILCVCGHTADDHHGWWVAGSKRIADECEIYGSNELGGLMPVHDNGELCPHAGIWYTRAEDGVFRAPDGSTEEDHECDKSHSWVDHCHKFRPE